MKNCEVCKGELALDVHTDFDGTFHIFFGWWEEISVEEYLEIRRDTDNIERFYCKKCGLLYHPSFIYV
jgi:hypothetical protein